MGIKVFELRMSRLGILDGCLVKVDDRYLNEHIQFVWEQYSKQQTPNERKEKIMKNKYAELINQLERVTEAYDRALEAVKILDSTVGEQPDVLGVSGGVTYLSDDIENRRAIHLADGKILTSAALDCGSDFQHREHGDKYTRVDCTLFGYRVFALVYKGSAEEACFMDLAGAEK